MTQDKFLRQQKEVILSRMGHIETIGHGILLEDNFGFPHPLLKREDGKWFCPLTQTEYDSADLAIDGLSNYLRELDMRIVVPFKDWEVIPYKK